MERPDNRLLTAKQAADTLMVTPATITRWRQRGVLKGIKVGGALRIFAADVERILDEGRAGS